MPSGGLMALVAMGAQELYLSGNPQIMLFKNTYKKHTFSNSGEILYGFPCLVELKKVESFFEDNLDNFNELMYISDFENKFILNCGCIVDNSDISECTRCGTKITNIDNETNAIDSMKKKYFKKKIDPTEIKIVL